MAFVTTSSQLSLKSPNLFSSSSIHKHRSTQPVLKNGRPSFPQMIQSTTKPHTKTAAHVVDTQVASRIEAHHWIVIKPQAMRVFERAAVAQADIARQLECRKGAGALHRWVLRHVVSPSAEMDISFPYGDGIYVVMEAFKPIQQAYGDANPLTRRWLSAVERVGPIINTVAIQTRHYDNLFTCKFHDVVFDPNANIVVLNSINVDSSKSTVLKRVVEQLNHIAEESVQTGQCLEFCVLQAPGEKGFLKTIEVYKDVDAMKKSTQVWDTSITQRFHEDIIENPHTRQIFKPVVFS